MSSTSYICIKKIGKGTYGEVWLVEHKIHKKCVLKIISLLDAKEKEKVLARSECELLKKLKHPNIVQYYDSFEKKGSLYIAMLYCEGGDLYSKLKEQNGRKISEKQVLEWFIQIIMALSYIHSQNILHRDLKTQNIFLAKSLVIKVGDLGIAKQLQNKSDMTSTLVGTPFYMSPEIFNKQPYNFKSDIWSLGCIAYELVTLKPAFDAKDFDALSMKITTADIPPMPSFYSEDLIDLITSMFNKRPDKRPSTNKILRLPFIQKHIKDFLKNIKKKKFLPLINPPPFRNRSQSDFTGYKPRNYGFIHNRHNTEKLADKFVFDLRVPIQSRDFINGKPGYENDICDRHRPNNHSSLHPIGGQYHQPSRTVIEEQMEKLNIASDSKHSFPVVSSANLIKQSIISPLLSGNENNDRQSARDRRREKNRNEGLTTMLVTCPDGSSDDCKVDEPEKPDSARLSARDRRRNSSEADTIVKLPQLRRRSADDIIVQSDDGARAEIMSVLEMMTQTLVEGNMEDMEIDRSSPDLFSVDEDYDNGQERTVILDDGGYSTMRKYVHVS